MLIDTHCHLDFKDYDRDRDEVVRRAKDAGVGRIINVASSIDGTGRSIELAKRYDIVYASLGVHPHEADSVTDAVIDDFRRLVKEDKIVAIGEVGLDYYRNLSPKDSQIETFRKFMRLAKELDLPIILHSRDANDDLLQVLQEDAKGGLKGVVHCFSGDRNFLTKCLDMGFFVSFTCNLTFKNAKDLREVAKNVPVERLLLETDAPFLTPQEFRGRRNEPAYLSYLVDEWVNILNLSKDDIARITTHNANELFKLGVEEVPEITYRIRDSLYLNITNRCTNSCGFCVRNYTSFVKGHNLKLKEEPSSEEILKAVGDPSRYREIVFCGYGEPTLRLDVIKDVARKVKKAGGRVRLVTNGHGDLINSRSIAGELAEVIDKLSVSLNVDTEDKYNKVCIPEFGAQAYGAILNFIKDCVKNNIETEITCLDLPGVDIGKCKEMAGLLGAEFRLRKLGVTG